MMPKGNIVERTLIILEMFNAGPVSAGMIARRLGIKRKSANGWIDNFSLVLPIRESKIGGCNNREIFYELVK